MVMEKKFFLVYGISSQKKFFGFKFLTLLRANFLWFFLKSVLFSELPSLAYKLLRLL